MKSLHVILDLKPKVIYPAHGKVIEDPVAKIEYYISHRNQRESQILKTLQDNKGETLEAMDIVKIVYTVIVKSFNIIRLSPFLCFRKLLNICTPWLR